MFSFIKKADIILIAVLIAFGLAAAAVLSGAGSSGYYAVITVDGNEYGSYSLAKDRVIKLKTGNTISIKDGEVSMKKSTCRGQDCVHMGKISNPPGSIICLPHKVVIEIKGKSNGYDTIAK